MQQAGCKWYLRPVVQLLQLMTTVLSYGQCLTIPRFRHEAASVRCAQKTNHARACAAQKAKAFSPIISPITHDPMQDLCRRLANEIVRLRDPHADGKRDASWHYHCLAGCSLTCLDHFSTTTSEQTWGSVSIFEARYWEAFLILRALDF